MQPITTTKKLYSWNINGIRSAHRKGILEWIQKEQPDVLCLQEIKAQEDQVPLPLKNIPDYYIFFNPAQRKGYSGVATYTKEKPSNVINGLGEERFDIEGRTLITEYKDFVLFNVYYPNGKRDEERLQYKLDFYRRYLEVADTYKEKGKHVITCGDYNTAHTDIDLSRPKQNEKRSGFLPIERAWLDSYIQDGYIDTWRHLNPTVLNRYTWWDQKTRARERNVGWRIDYFFIDSEMAPHLKNALIHDDVLGSDHCPISIEIGL